MRGIILLVAVAASAWGQPTRESYRAPYQAWRQAAPALEQDAATPGPAFAAQLVTSAEAAQTFFKARVAYIPAMQSSAAEQVAWANQSLAHPDKLLETPEEVKQLLAVAAAKVATNVSAFASDKDPAIRQLRQAMERERAALRALTDTLNARKTSIDELVDIADETEIQRALVYQALTSGVSRRAQLAEHLRLESEDWAKYYKDLEEGALSGGRISSAVGPAAPNAIGQPRINRPPSNGPLPMSRYTGEWIFPRSGLFYGPQPEAVEVVVQEASGNMTGTLTARFAATAGSSQTPSVTLTFQGSVQDSKTQTFPLQTSDGSAGTIELIPGSAINLLEVTVQIEAKPGKLSSANFILVKR